MRFFRTAQFAAAPTRRTAIAFRPPSANSIKHRNNTTRQSRAGRSLCPAEARNSLCVRLRPPQAAARVQKTFLPPPAGSKPTAESRPAYFISLSGFFLRNASHDDDPRAAFLPPPSPFTRSAPMSVSMGVRAVK